MMLLSMLAVVFADGGETGGEGSDGNGTALIIGCVVGGVISVAIVIAVIYCCLRKNNNYYAGNVDPQSGSDLKSDPTYRQVTN